MCRIKTGIEGVEGGRKNNAERRRSSTHTAPHYSSEREGSKAREKISCFFFIYLYVLEMASLFPKVGTALSHYYLKVKSFHTE